MKTKNILIGIFAIWGIFAFSSCVKQNFDQPPTNCDQIDINPTFTINELKSLFTGDTTRLADSVIIEGYVISTDQYGNQYKELVIQDSTGGIDIMLDASYIFTKYPVGQKVYIKCGGLYLGKDYGVIKLGSLYEDYGVTKFGRIQGDAIIDEHIVRSCDNEIQEPKVITLSEISDAYVYQLVKIENVQFSTADTSSTWADGINFYSENHDIIDSNFNSLIVRSSGYASFAKNKLPSGKGSIIGILGKYNSDYQLYIRNLDDVDMDSPRFIEPIYKDFEDGSLYSGGWITKVVTGTVNWTIGNYSGNDNYAQCTNYSGGSNSASEAWYISPELNLSAYNNPVLNFKNAYNYTGDPLEVKYSIDYDGVSSPSTATWTALSPTLSSGGFAWVSSGDLSLPKNNGVYIAFIYKGTNSDGSTWEIDNIKISDK